MNISVLSLLALPTRAIQLQSDSVSVNSDHDLQLSHLGLADDHPGSLAAEIQRYGKGALVPLPLRDNHDLSFDVGSTNCVELLNKLELDEGLCSQDYRTAFKQVLVVGPPTEWLWQAGRNDGVYYHSIKGMGIEGIIRQLIVHGIRSTAVQSDKFDSSRPKIWYVGFGDRLQITPALHAVDSSDKNILRIFFAEKLIKRGMLASNWITCLSSECSGLTCTNTVSLLPTASVFPMVGDDDDLQQMLLALKDVFWEMPYDEHRSNAVNGFSKVTKADALKFLGDARSFYKKKYGSLKHIPE